MHVRDDLKLDGGLNDLHVSEAEEFLAFTIKTRPSFKGDGGTRSIIAMLDRKQQRLLFLYLQERLKRRGAKDPNLYGS